MLGELLLNALCEILGEGVYPLVKKLIEEIDEDPKKALYGLILTYSGMFVHLGDKIKVKRRISCLDLGKLLGVEDERIEIPKPENEDEVLKNTVLAIGRTIKSMIGESYKALVMFVAKILTDYIKTPEGIALRAASELSRNPYVPRFTVELSGRVIKIYVRFSMPVDESILESPLFPLAIAYAYAKLSGAKDIKIKESSLVDDHTAIIEAELVTDI